MARLTFGKEGGAVEERRILLIIRDVSSLVIDTLYDRVGQENASVAFFYFGFAQEQSLAAVLGSVLKHIVGGLEEVPGGIVRAFQDKEGVSGGGQRLALAEIAEFLKDISSSQRTFLCIDALDECPSEHRVKLLDLFNQILQKSPGTRLFLTGRPHIRGEVEKHLGGRAVCRSITPNENDIVSLLRERQKRDPDQEEMDEVLREEIIQSITDTYREM